MLILVLTKTIKASLSHLSKIVENLKALGPKALILGSNVMKDLIKYPDENNLPIALTPIRQKIL